MKTTKKQIEAVVNGQLIRIVNVTEKIWKVYVEETLVGSTDGTGSKQAAMDKAVNYANARTAPAQRAETPQGTGARVRATMSAPTQRAETPAGTGDRIRATMLARRTK